MQFLPLLMEKILHEFFQLDAVPQPFGKSLQSPWLPALDIGRPLGPGRAPPVPLIGHEQGIIFQPVGFPVAESHIIPVFLAALADNLPLEFLEAFLQALALEIYHPLKINERASPRVGQMGFAGGDPFLFDQLVNIYQQGIARKGRGRLVRRIAEAHRPQGQYLPDRLP